MLGKDMHIYHFWSYALGEGAASKSGLSILGPGGLPLSEERP